jgi:predicted protein tyrosine phosphatase
MPAEMKPPFELHLKMHDIASPMEGFVAPTADMVSALLAFARDWRGERPLLVHCWAGVSRSTAAAFAVACARWPELSEQAIAQAMRAASPEASPNRLIVSIADDLLGRGGRMRLAIEAAGSGAECTIGRPFFLLRYRSGRQASSLAASFIENAASLEMSSVRTRHPPPPGSS